MYPCIRINVNKINTYYNLDTCYESYPLLNKLFQIAINR